MDEKSLEMLEFPKVREILAGYASFSASHELALKLVPSSDADLISRSLNRSAEARRLLSLRPEFSIRGAVDIRESVGLAARGKVLDPQSLGNIQHTLAAARYVRNDLHKLADTLPLLWAAASRIVGLPSLEEEIGRCFTTTGEMLDSASPKLARLRDQLKDTQQQIHNRLESVMKSPRGRRALQSPYVTERDGRYVLPLKAEFRKELKGIVHDVSNTGATVFVEPWSTVDLGNDLRQLTIEETREVERILMALSSQVGASEVEISGNVGLLAELDLDLIKARYAEEARATEPEIFTPDSSGQDKAASRGILKLVNARHPLLAGKAVPLSVEMGDDYSILVITGPNTGGKTVALKTIGLLTIMAQAGIPIPAGEESYIPVFDGVYADIGDEQSIEQTLSTFSWHMGNIVRIIESSSEKGLVLLDELGTSTDPNEGAALARAILLHFLSKGVMVVATTHFSELKVFAHSTPGLRNASLDFNPVTLAPTYHLTMGVPGGSNALAIASRLGLTPDIVESAREMMTKGSQDIEMLLADMVSDKLAVEELRNGLEEEKKTAEKLRVQYNDELKKLQEQEHRTLKEERDKLTGETAELQKEIRRAVSELKKARSQENLEQAERALATMREQLKSMSSRIKARPGRLAGEEVEAGEIKAGDKVWLSDMDTWGTVLSVRPEEALIEVQVGQTRLRLGLGDAEKIKPPPGKTLPEPRMVTHKLSTRTPALELDLRGKRADEVVPELEQYLNDASLAGLSQVRIIHGYGTGVVRQIVRDSLASHSLVKSFRPGERGEGGDGVTMVKL